MTKAAPVFGVSLKTAATAAYAVYACVCVHVCVCVCVCMFLFYLLFTGFLTVRAVFPVTFDQHCCLLLFS